MAIVLTLALAASACGGSDPVQPDSTLDEPAAASDSASEDAPTAEPAPAPTTEAEKEPVVSTEEEPEPTPAPATFAATVRPSVNQLHVIDAEPGTMLELVARNSTSADDTPIAAGTVDEFGSFLWRDIDAGDYQVMDSTGATSSSVTVTSPQDLPAPGFYSGQTIVEGFGYVTTRDGTTLSLNVTLPAGDGPFPTVVEYSGYAPSNPGDTTSAQLYSTLGFAYVGVNIRGTGCSGGSFQFFEPIQRVDGYDMIEAIAAQPWVEHNMVGMVGISYPGISQLFVAETQPPSLAAITPLSVIDDTFRSTLYPGGILNTGFAVNWSSERQAGSDPYGQGWEQGQVDAGDTICETNQQLRGQNPNAIDLILDNEFYDPAVGDELAPIDFVDRINVPVFMAGAWQDEQTGGHFPAMIESFTSSPAVFTTMVNGSHTESLSPAILERYIAFLDLYVARRVPGAVAALAAPLLSSSLTGETVTLSLDPRFDGLDYEAAVALFEADPLVRVLFEEGASDDFAPGAPAPRFEAAFDQWPPAGTATSWYLQSDGSLDGTARAASADSTSADSTSADSTSPGVTTYVSNPDALPSTIYSGGTSGVWQSSVDYDWQPIAPGTGADWVSAPLTSDVVAVGPGSLDLWIQADASDVDLEITLTEVRPNGDEVYVQSGWLRASHRALDESLSTAIAPVHTHLESDAAPLAPGEFSALRVELFPFAHAFRSGSRLRITVDAPGGARPLWAFAQTYPAGVNVSIAHDALRPSALVLNVVDGVAVPAGYPECGALRSQPCRSYVELDD